MEEWRTTDWMVWVGVPVAALGAMLAIWWAADTSNELDRVQIALQNTQRDLVRLEGRVKKNGGGMKAAGKGAKGKNRPGQKGKKAGAKGKNPGPKGKGQKSGKGKKAGAKGKKSKGGN